jgi:integrase
MTTKNKKGYMIKGDKIYVQGSIDGVFKRYSTKKLATKMNIAWIKKNHKQELIKIHEQKSKPKQTTNFIQYALENLELNKNRRKSSTQKEYKSAFDTRIAPYFKNYDIKDIKRNDLMVWQQTLLQSGITARTVNSIRSIFRFILEEAKKDEIIDKNYFDIVDALKQIKPEIKPFSLDEVKLILSNSSGWQKSFFKLAFFTGMRSGEMIGLKWEDINFVSKTINIKRAIRQGVESTPKTESSIRTIDMLPIVEEALNDQKQYTYLRQSYIFLTSNNKPHATCNNLRDGVWKNTLKISGLDYRILYQTRHTFASIMISAGEDIVWVSNMLGHTDVSMTLSKYTKYIKNTKVKRASFLDDFNEEKNCTKTAKLVFDKKVGF